MEKFTRCICITLACVFFLAVPAYAAQGSEVQPLYDSVSSIQLTLDLNTNSGRADCTVEVVPYGYIPINVEVKLQRLVDGRWTTFHSWEDSGTGMVTINKYYYVYSGYSYRLWAKATVYNSNGTVIDTVTETSPIYYYP